MTAPHPSGLVCPQCGGVDTSVGGSGNGMCFECAYTWDPAVEHGTARDAVAPFGMAPVEEVFGDRPPRRPVDLDTGKVWPEGMGDAMLAEDVDTYNDRLAELVGGVATLEGGQTAIVVTFTDDERVVVTLATGDTEVVPLSDVERIVPPAPPAVEPVEVEVEAEPPVEMQAMMLMASKILEAGVKASYALTQSETLIDVPTGYLPEEPALWSIVEQACVVAIGMLIDATDMDAEAVALWFGIELEVPTEGDQTTEDDNGEGPTEAG